MEREPMVRVILHTDMIRGGRSYTEGEEAELPQSEALRFIDRRMAVAVETAAVVTVAETASITHTNTQKGKRYGRN